MHAVIGGARSEIIQAISLRKQSSYKIDTITIYDWSAVVLVSNCLDDHGCPMIEMT